MTVKPILTHGILFLVGGLLVCFFKPTATSPPVKEVVTKTERQTQHVKPPAGQPYREVTEKKTSFNMRSLFKKPTKEELDAYIKANGNNPRDMIICAMSGKHPELIREAVKNAPNDPLVLYLASTCKAARKGLTKEEQLSFSKQFHERFPNEVMAHYAHAVNLRENRQIPESIEVLKGIPEEVEINFYEKEVMASNLDFRLSSGVDSAYAQIGAVMEQNHDASMRLNGLSKELMGYSHSLPTEEGDEIRMLVANIGQDLNSNERNFLSQHLGKTISRESIAHLEDDDVTFFNGMTKAEANQEFTADWSKYTKLKMLVDYETFPTTHPELFKSASNRMLLMGQDQTVDWLVYQLENGKH